MPGYPKYFSKSATTTSKFFPPADTSGIDLVVNKKYEVSQKVPEADRETMLIEGTKYHIELFRYSDSEFAAFRNVPLMSKLPFFKQFVLVHNLLHPQLNIRMPGAILRIKKEEGFSSKDATNLKTLYPERFHVFPLHDEEMKKQVEKMRIQRQCELEKFLGKIPLCFRYLGRGGCGVTQQQQQTNDNSSSTSTNNTTTTKESLLYLLQYNDKSLVLLATDPSRIAINTPLKSRLEELGFTKSAGKFKHPAFLQHDKQYSGLTISPKYISSAAVSFFQSMMMQKSSNYDNQDGGEEELAREWEQVTNYGAEIEKRKQELQKQEEASRDPKKRFREMMKDAPVAEFKSVEELWECLSNGSILVLGDGLAQVESFTTIQGGYKQLKIMNTIVEPQGTRKYYPTLANMKKDRKAVWNESYSAWYIFYNKIDENFLTFLRSTKPKKIKKESEDDSISKNHQYQSPPKQNVITSMMNSGTRRQRDENADEDEGNMIIVVAPAPPPPPPPQAPTALQLASPAALINQKSQDDDTKK